MHGASLHYTTHTVLAYTTLHYTTHTVQGTLHKAHCADHTVLHALPCKVHYATRTVQATPCKVTLRYMHRARHTTQYTTLPYTHRVSYTTLQCTMLHYTTRTMPPDTTLHALCYTTLHTLHYTSLHVLHRAPLHYTLDCTLHYTTLHYP